MQMSVEEKDLLLIISPHTKHTHGILFWKLGDGRMSLSFLGRDPTLIRTYGLRRNTDNRIPSLGEIIHN
jgi:hypothetical protein